jgi:hypothetical protein
MDADYPFIAVAEAQCHAGVTWWPGVVEQQRIDASNRFERAVPPNGRGVTEQHS